MTLADKLASALDRRDETPNIELAENLAAKNEISTEILELLGILKNGKKDQRHDAVKVLYELAARRPNELAAKLDLILEFLPQKDNRISWGILTLVAEIGAAQPSLIQPHLDVILAAADQGSVIAKDRAMDILLSLMAHNHQKNGDKNQTEPHLMVAVENAPINQLPMYAENAVTVLKGTSAKNVAALLQKRIGEAPTEAKKKRLEKAIKQLNAK